MPDQKEAGTKARQQDQAAENCGYCRRFTLDPKEEMTAHGYGRCALVERWRYFSARSASCVFSPSRFAASLKQALKAAHAC